LRQPEEVRTLLLGRDRRRNAPTAEPQGLMLRRIDYPPAFRLPVPV
jgi:tRNA U38,U39,U40 pseudouridine synthase TruA